METLTHNCTAPEDDFIVPARYDQLSMNSMLLATTNAGKVTELRELLSDLPIELKSLADFEAVEEPVEDGETFAENARIKARYYAKALGLTAVADDSGLEVTSLDGRPGVYSARFAGDDASDHENNLKLLSLLSGKTGPARGARFQCVIGIADPAGDVIAEFSGSCSGQITTKPFGSNGFGYDPLFRPDGYEKTFGELPDEIKHRLSHRALAARKLADFLADNLGLLT